MAGLLYAAVYAVESAFLAEGSQAEVDWRAVRSRSRRLAIMLFVPGGSFLALTAHWVLLAFGSRYSQHGTTSLELLAAAVIPIAACNWSWTVLRLSGRLVALVVSNAVYSGAVCGFAWILACHGLTALTAAWRWFCRRRHYCYCPYCHGTSQCVGTPSQNNAPPTVLGRVGFEGTLRYPCAIQSYTSPPGCATRYKRPFKVHVCQASGEQGDDMRAHYAR